MAKAQRSQNDILFIFRRRRRRVERNNNKLDGLKKGKRVVRKRRVGGDSTRASVDKVYANNPAWA